MGLEDNARNSAEIVRGKAKDIVEQAGEKVKDTERGAVDDQK